MINGTNLLGKDNPRWLSGNRVETIKLVAAVPAQLTAPPREQSRLRLQAWITSLPHRIGAWLHRPDDTEAGWWHWQITELRGGFARSYRDVRFDVLRQLHELTARHGRLGAGSSGEPGGSPLCPVPPRGPGWRRAPLAASPHANPFSRPNGSWRLLALPARTKGAASPALTTFTSTIAVGFQCPAVPIRAGYFARHGVRRGVCAGRCGGFAVVVVMCRAAGHGGAAMGGDPRRPRRISV